MNDFAFATASEIEFVKFVEMIFYNRKLGNDFDILHFQQHSKSHILQGLKLIVPSMQVALFSY